MGRGWTGVVEFERAQPEDTGAGLGTTTGVAYNTAPPITGTPGVAPWPAFGYLCGNRMPVGLSATPTLPVANTQATHGGVIAVPRVRCSTGDLTGLNAHVYSAMTITTGRWGHLFELAGGGSYQSAGTVSAGALTGAANVLFQPHMGHMVPVYTNVYNSKRFMFSPVVVLGPAYDPDVRGRLYGLKVLPSALGTLMDTVSITVDGNYFYNTGFTASDHWVMTTPPSGVVITSAYPGQYPVATTRFTLTQNTPQIQQSWRSLEDVSTQASSTAAVFINNFRFALPA